MSFSSPFVVAFPFRSPHPTCWSVCVNQSSVLAIESPATNSIFRTRTRSQQAGAKLLVYGQVCKVSPTTQTRGEREKKAPEPSTVHAALSVCAEAGFDALVGCMLFLANYYFLSFFGFLFFWPYSLLVWCAYNVTCVHLTISSLVLPKKHDAVD